MRFLMRADLTRRSIGLGSVFAVLEGAFQPP